MTEVQGCALLLSVKTGNSLHVHQEETWLHKSQHRHSYSSIRTKDGEIAPQQRKARQVENLCPEA